MATRVAVDLATLTCTSETEGGSEPYLWPVLIGEEGGIARLRVPEDEFAAKTLASGMQAGQSVAIPPGMDLVLGHVFDDPAASLIVLLVALFEKDSSPRHGSVAVLRHIEDRTLSFVQDQLAVCRQSSGQRDDLRSALFARFDLAKAERDALSLAERIKTRLSSGSFDDSVDFKVFAFSGPALANRSLTIPLTRDNDRFTLTGEIRLSIVVPPKCQAERDAVAQARAVVTGLQTQREFLQQRLQTATPQQKPALIDQIQRIAEVDLPPAEAALAQAETALKQCEALFGGTHGSLNNPIILG